MTAMYVSHGARESDAFRTAMNDGKAEKEMVLLHISQRLLLTFIAPLSVLDSLHVCTSKQSLYRCSTPTAKLANGLSKKLPAI